MPRYIEIQDGITISVDSIESIERQADNKTKVYAHKRLYISTYPYDVLLAMLKEEEVIVDKKTSTEEASKRTMEKLDKVLGSVTHPAW